MDNHMDQIILLMNYLENLHLSTYSLFMFAINMDKVPHCNLFLYDYKINIWYRIEPNGMILCGEEIYNQYDYVDIHIKKVKTNYLSQNDYHLLPGLCYINPGYYCMYYAVMMVEEYINNNNMFDVIEKISNIDYIEKKLKEYKSILKF